jgi:hypothetical protein
VGGAVRAVPKDFPFPPLLFLLKFLFKKWPESLAGMTEKNRGHQNENRENRLRPARRGYVVY